jgi:hypothetical protein
MPGWRRPSRAPTGQKHHFADLPESAEAASISPFSTASARSGRRGRHLSILKSAVQRRTSVTAVMLADCFVTPVVDTPSV